jgi:hypothetical protein
VTNERNESKGRAETAPWLVSDRRNGLPLWTAPGTALDVIFAIQPTATFRSFSLTGYIRHWTYCGASKDPRTAGSLIDSSAYLEGIDG